jgi:hypothetical protein
MMVSIGDLEGAVYHEFAVIYRRCMAELKHDAEEIEALREEIRVVITRTEVYLSTPISTPPPAKPVAVK